MHKPIFSWGAAAATASKLWGDELTGFWRGSDPALLSLSSFLSLRLSPSLFLSGVSLTRPVSQADIGKRVKSRKWHNRPTNSNPNPKGPLRNSVPWNWNLPRWRVVSFSSLLLLPPPSGSQQSSNRELERVVQ
ncbi:hypothetical protein BO83DRAFT_377449 [Aspergillus eucalypticola CBS 122712]|uniref:Uncharacterized protein n=1 Tax=Aspergillus eucalypticola (strain CBS 122712 / IBT 29274) TaxID=1448314 RepID=A0A317VRU1_ASPEC|nr:uncharacterized protein BO83DRAFT_377449 [Aspergillus eucalypticola CBS 122712]PWY75608.1 hypothetical protein BO83DRAFT_377449 [Aspergillus eucalypticola CBS 122712]